MLVASPRRHSPLPKRLALCWAALACGMATISGSAVAAEGTLGGAHLGTSLSAPPAPSVGGQPPVSVSYEWRRCLRYSTLVTADGAEHLWHLNDPSATAADSLGSLVGHYAGSHVTSAEGPLTGEADATATFDGKTSAVAVSGAPDYGGTRPYTHRAVGSPGDDRLDIPVPLLPRADDRCRATGDGDLAVKRRPGIRAVGQRRRRRRGLRDGARRRGMEPCGGELRRNDHEAVRQRRPGELPRHDGRHAQRSPNRRRSERERAGGPDSSQAPSAMSPSTPGRFCAAMWVPTRRREGALPARSSRAPREPPTRPVWQTWVTRWV